MFVAKLPKPPRIDVQVVLDRGASGAGFLRVRQLELRNRYADGKQSKPYGYFVVERELLDAVAILLYRRTTDGPQVVVRSQLRPPLAFRHQFDVPMPAEGTGAVQWEVPAGLCEHGERGELGVLTRASIEAHEEVGFRISPQRFLLLGHPTSLSPGLLAEKLHFACAEILPSDVREVPDGDGHAVEEGSESVLVPLDEALRAVDEGMIHDLKTEVALFRLARKLGSP
jgi:ADP-ribose pyrophosphatase